MKSGRNYLHHVICILKAQTNIGDGSSSFGGKVEIDYIAFTSGAYAPAGDSPCDAFLSGDLNKDCYVNLLDLKLLCNNILGFIMG